MAESEGEGGGFIPPLWLAGEWKMEWEQRSPVVFSLGERTTGTSDDAAARALALLEALMTRKQRSEWRKSRRQEFRVRTPQRRRYVLTGEGTWYDGGRPRQKRCGCCHFDVGEHLCVVVEHESVPIYDTLLAKKLLLESPGGEDYFVSIAG
jgi:hypothetical protein